MLFLKVFPFEFFGKDLVKIGGEETFSGVSKESNEFPFRVLCLVLLLFIVVYVFARCWGVYMSASRVEM